MQKISLVKHYPFHAYDLRIKIIYLRQICLAMAIQM